MSPCFFAKLGHAGCFGRIDPAHFIPQQRIKEALRRRGCTEAEVAAAVWDSRVYTKACRAHHTAFDNKVLQLAKEQYPEALKEWAAEYRFEWRGARDGWRALYKEAA